MSGSWLESIILIETVHESYVDFSLNFHDELIKIATNAQFVPICQGNFQSVHRNEL